MFQWQQGFYYMKLFEAEAPYKNAILNSILFLILIAVALFYGNTIGSWTLSNDELSLIYRSHFETFTEVLNLGVRTEAHPPLSHLFMWIWLKLTPNQSAFWIRFPFATLGVFGFIIFALAVKKQFNTLLAIAFVLVIAWSNYILIYTTLARPYALGLFFLAAAYFALGLKNQKLSFVLFLITGFGAIYSHYFSLLALVFLWGYSLKYASFGWTQKLLVAIVWVIGFLPYLPVFFDQFAQEKLNWLAAPSNTFLVDFLLNFCNNSSIGILLLLVLFVIGMLINPTQKGLILLVPFFLSFGIALIYSLIKGPILQFSTLFFTFPFAVLGMLAFTYNSSKTRQALILASALVFGSWQFSQLKTPNEYAYFGVFEELVDANNDWLLNPDFKKSACVSSLNNSYYFDYYNFLGSNRLINTSLQNDNDLHVLDSILKSLNTNSLVFSYSSKAIHPKAFVIISSYFPYLISKREYYNSGTYILSKTKSTKDCLHLGPPEKKLASQQNCKEEYCFVETIELFEKEGILVAQTTVNNSLTAATLVLEVTNTLNEKEWHGTDFKNENKLKSRIYEACFIDSTAKSYTTYIWNRGQQSVNFSEIESYILPIKPPLAR